MEAIFYQYLGQEQVPSKWEGGRVISYEYKPCWYSGMEYVDESRVKERVKELKAIVNDDRQKKYQNIQVGFCEHYEEAGMGMCSHCGLDCKPHKCDGYKIDCAFN